MNTAPETWDSEGVALSYISWEFIKVKSSKLHTNTYPKCNQELLANICISVVLVLSSKQTLFTEAEAVVSIVTTSLHKQQFH